MMSEWSTHSYMYLYVQLSLQPELALWEIANDSSRPTTRSNLYFLCGQLFLPINVFQVKLYRPCMDVSLGYGILSYVRLFPVIIFLEQTDWSVKLLVIN